MIGRFWYQLMLLTGRSEIHILEIWLADKKLSLKYVVLYS